MACGPCSVRIGGCSGRLLRRAGLWLWCVACVPSREERLSSWLWLAAMGVYTPCICVDIANDWGYGRAVRMYMRDWGFRLRRERRGYGGQVRFEERRGYGGQVRFGKARVRRTGPLRWKARLRRTGPLRGSTRMRWTGPLLGGTRVRRTGPLRRMVRLQRAGAFSQRRRWAGSLWPGLWRVGVPCGFA